MDVNNRNYIPYSQTLSDRSAALHGSHPQDNNPVSAQNTRILAKYSQDVW